MRRLVVHQRRSFRLFAVASLALSVGASRGMAQDLSGDDIGKDIAVAIVIPPNRPGFDEAVGVQLESRLAQVMTGTGLAAVAGESRYVLYPSVVITGEQSTGGTLRAVTVVKLDMTLFLKGIADGTLYSSMSRSLVGSGSSRNAAIINAVSSLRGDDDELREFAKGARRKIVDYYMRSCDVVIGEAQTAARTGQADRALGNLLTVPAEAGSCHQRAQGEAVKIYAANQQALCAARVRSASANVANDRFDDAISELEGIDPTTPCSKDADALIDRMSKRVDTRTSQSVSLRLNSYRAWTEQIRSTVGNGTPLATHQLRMARVEAAAFFNKRTARAIPAALFR